MQDLVDTVRHWFRRAGR